MHTSTPSLLSSVFVSHSLLLYYYPSPPVCVLPEPLNSPPPSPSLLSCFEDRVVSQDFAELIEAILHLGDTSQLGLQTLLLLCEGEPGRRVQLLETPTPLPVELQQVSVVLPEEKTKTKQLNAQILIISLILNIL